MKRSLLALSAVSCVALAFWAIGARGANEAAPRTLTGESPEVREQLAHLADVIAVLSRGDVDSAYQKYSERLVVPPPKDIGEFENEHRAGFRRLFERFPKPIESLDLMALTRLSSQSQKLSCVANSKHGPVIVEAIIYRYRDSWGYAQIGYQPYSTLDGERAKLFTAQFPTQPLPSPVTIPIRGDVIEKVSNTKE